MRNVKKKLKKKMKKKIKNDARAAMTSQRRRERARAPGASDRGPTIPSPPPRAQNVRYCDPPCTPRETIPRKDPEMTTKKAPSGLQSAGKRLWWSVVDDYELDVHEEILLLQACRCADRLDTLAKEATTATITNTKGDVVAHPALVESRQQSITLSRLLASMRLPSGDEGEQPQRPPRRGGARGSYGVRGVV
ncbi:hypothetical protein [Janibacter sp. YB324]|uniref:hypothetical protein n=1 Tax=Janibacter sp. YB324 TaxID=2761047 RepID=UPI001CB957A5|nr:hypothetical protein [Janibacter sp. YB324]